MSYVLDLIKSFNWHAPTWDLFILAAWALASVFYAFAAGRGRIINILFSVYMARLLTLEAPFLSQAITKNLPPALVSFQQLVIFAGLFLILFILLGRFVFKTSADGRNLGSVLFGLIFSLLQVGLLLSIVLSYLPDNIKNNFSQLIQLLFLKNPAPFVWLILPVLYLIFLGKFISDSNEI